MLDADCGSVYATKLLHDLAVALIPIKGNHSYETLIPKSFNYLKKSLTMVKDQVFIVNLHHDGIFIASPLRYVKGDLKQITDIDFEGIKELKINSDVQDFVRVGYENKWFVDLYVEHFDYDVMDFINKEANEVLSGGSSDEYYSSIEIEKFDEVDFHTKGEENVVIKNLTTHDPFLNKLCGNNGMFRDYLDESVPETEGEALDDPDDAHIDPIHKAQKRSLLFYYGRSVEGGRCAGKYSNKKKKIKKSLFPNEDAESSKSVKSAPKSSKKSAKSTKSAKSASKSTKSAGKYVKSGIKKKVSFSQPIQTRNKKTREGCSNAGEGSSKSQPSKSPQTSPKTPQTLPKVPSDLTYDL
ncbi:hypothetical protein Tco_0155168 [Tanacetum coccineum]